MSRQKIQTAFLSRRGAHHQNFERASIISFLFNSIQNNEKSRLQKEKKPEFTL